MAERLMPSTGEVSPPARAATRGAAAPDITPEQAAGYQTLLTALTLENGHQLRVTGVEIARAAGYTLNAPSTVEAGVDAYLTVMATPPPAEEESPKT